MFARTARRSDWFRWRTSARQTSTRSSRDRSRPTPDRKLRRGGMTVQTRQYVRKDGKTIRLVPMAHVGEADFYQKLSRSFPTNSIILMEGVTDRRNLLTNELSYKRMATSLGVTEQGEEFNPTQGEMVWADVDVEQFTTNTIGFFNLCVVRPSNFPD